MWERVIKIAAWTTVSTAALQRLLGVGKPALTELAARSIIKRGSKRGT